MDLTYINETKSIPDEFKTYLEFHIQDTLTPHTFSQKTKGEAGGFFCYFFVFVCLFLLTRPGFELVITKSFISDSE